jgi:peroxiredoxin Q/BCP
MKSLVILGLVMGLLAGACGGGQHDANEAPAKHDLLAVGSEVPPLVRVDHRGQVISLRSSTPTLIYFYPRDGTPGCTKEACAFRDAWQAYDLAGLRVIGVSSDSEKAHREFAEEHNLPFSLIADPEHVWSKAFGVGSFMGFDSRVSFLISGEGRVVKAYEDVDPGVHAKEVLADAAALGLTAKPTAPAAAPAPPEAAPVAPATP